MHRYPLEKMILISTRRPRPSQVHTYTWYLNTADAFLRQRSQDILPPSGASDARFREMTYALLCSPAPGRWSFAVPPVVPYCTVQLVHCLDVHNIAVFSKQPSLTRRRVHSPQLCAVSRPNFDLAVVLLAACHLRRRLSCRSFFDAA